jgi:hypothetical protein
MQHPPGILPDGDGPYVTFIIPHFGWLHGQFCEFGPQSIRIRDLGKLIMIYCSSQLQVDDRGRCPAYGNESFGLKVCGGAGCCSAPKTYCSHLGWLRFGTALCFVKSWRGALIAGLMSWCSRLRGPGRHSGLLGRYKRWNCGRYAEIRRNTHNANTRISDRRNCTECKRWYHTTTN